MGSRLEETFALHLRAAGIRDYEREYQFHPDRKWRFDFAWPDLRLAVEIEGGIWTRGRHTRGQGFIDDCDKYNSATAAGWRVLRFTEAHLDNLEAIEITGELLGASPD